MNAVQAYINSGHYHLSQTLFRIYDKCSRMANIVNDVTIFNIRLSWHIKRMKCAVLSIKAVSYACETLLILITGQATQTPLWSIWRSSTAQPGGRFWREKQGWRAPSFRSLKSPPAWSSTPSPSSGTSTSTPTQEPWRTWAGDIKTWVGRNRSVTFRAKTVPTQNLILSQLGP